MPKAREAFPVLNAHYPWAHSSGSRGSWCLQWELLTERLQHRRYTLRGVSLWQYVSGHWRTLGW